MVARTLDVNGINMAFEDLGEGPLVVLCHGWPETGHSWRHQAPALAAAGFRVAVPDMRGFGRTSAPHAIEAYSIFHLVGDIVALVGALNASRAAIVGHDWGAHVAWSAAMFRPDLFTCVGALSVPPTRRPPAPPLEILRQRGVTNFYWQYFQEPGIAEAEFEQDIERTLRAILFSPELTLMLAPGAGFLGRVAPPDLPPWMAPADFARFVAAFRASGFRGGLNYYRNFDRNWALTAPWQDALIRQPALFIAGARDAVIRGDAGAKRLAEMTQIVPNLIVNRLIDGALHWIQQERAEEVTDALAGFLREWG
jgi:pimeloyl-ACP methyl ester carboxylesterase